MIEQTRIAWLAGLIDGEGSISFYRQKTGSLCPALGIQMTHEATIREAQAVMLLAGCAVANVNRLERKANHKPWAGSRLWTSMSSWTIFEHPDRDVRALGAVHPDREQHRLVDRQIAVEIGATKEEVDLLYQDNVFEAKKIKDWKYSSAWYPQEDGIRRRTA